MEREVCALFFSAAAPGGTDFVLEFQIDLVFDALPPEFAAKRKAVYYSAYNIRIEEVTLGEITLNAAFCDDTWPDDLYPYWIASEISVCDPYCALLNWLNNPLFIPPPC